MVLDEPQETDFIYWVEEIKFIIDKQEERELSHLEIDYEKDWWGEDFVVTAGF